MNDDILSQIIRELMSAKEVGPAAVASAELRIRERWGGERVYVQKAPGRGKAVRLGGNLAAGSSLSDAFAAVGVSRTWGYRLLSRRAPRY